MSLYWKYGSEQAQTYDQVRSAMGLEVIIGALVTRLKKPLAEMHVLDAGCGTGNYAFSLLETGVGQITMVDASEEMLERSKVKVAEIATAQQKVTILQHKLPTIPFAGGSFDAVMFNFLLNHLVDHKIPNDEERFMPVKLAIGEAARVLRPGGVLIIQSSSQNQSDMHWCHQLNEKGKILWRKLYQSNDQLMSMLNEAGLTNVKKYPMLDAPNRWFDPSVMIDGCPFTNMPWDTWAKEDVDACIHFLQNLKIEQKYEKFCSEIQANREMFGDYTFAIATKSYATISS